jgi:peptidoglycan/LPS O-acetylase OafA/YrhL
MISRHTSRSIDIIRGLSALGVIWGHSIYGFEWPLELNGAFWVWIFLPVSGYLVGKGFEPERYGLSPAGYGRFLWNRGLRIVPLAELGLLLGLAIELTVGGGTPWTSAMRQFAFVSPMNNMSLAGPLWTVATELHFYLISILLAWVLGRRAPWWVGWVFWLASVWIGWHGIGLIGDNTAQPKTLLGNLPFFVFGLVLSTGRYDHLARVGRIGKMLLTAAPLTLAWYFANWNADYFWRWGKHSSVPYGGAAACALAVAAVVLCTQVRPNTGAWLRWTPMPFLWRGLAWCGFYTYGIYVYHSVLAKANSLVFQLHPGPGLLALLSCAVVIAPISYRVLELPIMRLKARGARQAPKPEIVAA